MQFDHSDPQPGLTIDDIAKAYLQEAARWGKFISIFGIVICGLMLMLGLAFTFSGVGAIYASMGVPPALIGIFYLLFTAIYLYPCVALLRFSTKVKEAILLNNDDILHSSFRFLKNHFKSIGILIIVMISIYVLLLLFLIIMGGVASMAS